MRKARRPGASVGKSYRPAGRSYPYENKKEVATDVQGGSLRVRAKMGFGVWLGARHVILRRPGSILVLRWGPVPCLGWGRVGLVCLHQFLRRHRIWT